MAKGHPMPKDKAARIKAGPRGGLPVELRAFYHSKRWKQTREAYIAKQHGLCEQCLTRGLITPGRIVHHRQKLTVETVNDINIALNHDNLELLCQSCHNRDEYNEHGLHSTRYVWLEDGTLAPKRERGKRKEKAEREVRRPV